ncbi:MAG: alpha/beta fold hydrolase [Actinomycetia bacterium]|nr:alpha/beta fold hydrolase [Actinomycetes bacterium]
MTRHELGDISVNYHRQGSGPAVVLLHGLAEDHSSWDPVLDHLAGHTVYAVDLRGHGTTTAGDGQGTLAQLSADLSRFVGELSGPAVVVGYSLGGTIALRAAVQADAPIESLIVVAASSVVGGAAAEFFAGRIAQIEAGDWEGFGAGLHDDTAQQVVGGADIELLTVARLQAVGTGEGYVNAARAMIGVRSAPLTPELARVTIPVEVIGGDQDVFCPRKAADMIVEALPDSRYHEIPDAGHLISVDQPERYGQLIADLVRGRAR